MYLRIKRVWLAYFWYWQVLIGNTYFLYLNFFNIHVGTSKSLNLLNTRVILKKYHNWRDVEDKDDRDVVYVVTLTLSR